MPLTASETTALGYSDTGTGGAIQSKVNSIQVWLADLVPSGPVFLASFSSRTDYCVKRIITIATGIQSSGGIATVCTCILRKLVQFATRLMALKNQQNFTATTKTSVTDILKTEDLF